MTSNRENEKQDPPREPRPPWEHRVLDKPKSDDLSQKVAGKVCQYWTLEFDEHRLEPVSRGWHPGAGVISRHLVIKGRSS